jgi:hypothetical protein
MREIMVTNKENKKQNIMSFIVGIATAYLAITQIGIIRDKVLEQIERKEEKEDEKENIR